MTAFKGLWSTRKGRDDLSLLCCPFFSSFFALSELSRGNYGLMPDTQFVVPEAPALPQGSCHLTTTATTTSPSRSILHPPFHLCRVNIVPIYR